MSRNLQSWRSQHCLFTASCISKAPHPSSARKRLMVLLEIFLTWSVKIPCLAVDTWESAESTLQKETATLAMNKAGLRLRRYPSDVCRRSSCPDMQLPALVPPGLEFLSTDFTAPAPPWGNPCLSAALLSPPVSAPGSYVPPPAILQVRKKNFVFLWDTVISGPFLPPGL